MIEHPSKQRNEMYTARLRLFPLPVDFLQLYLDHPNELERRLGFPISRDILTERVRRAVSLKIEKMTAIPEQDHPWYTYWLIIIANQPYGAGMAGFKGIQAGKQQVEIGYGIDPAYQNRGYMTEAVQALVRWAFQDPECQRVTALDTKKWNVASLRVLDKIGMRIYTIREDSYDLYIDKRWQ